MKIKKRTILVTGGLAVLGGLTWVCGRLFLGRNKGVNIKFRDSTPQAVDCGKELIDFSKGKVDIINLTTMEEPGCDFSSASRIFPAPLENLEYAVCKETGTKNFDLPKGEVRTIQFEGKLNLRDRLSTGVRDFRGEYKVLGI